MGEKNLPDPGYLRSLEIELFVPHRRLPGAPAHFLYEAENPRRRSARRMEAMRASQTAPRPGRRKASANRAPVRPPPRRETARVHIAGAHFQSAGVFTADSLEGDSAPSAAWRALLANILFACGAAPPAPEDWPPVLTSQRLLSAGTGEEERRKEEERGARDYISAAIGFNQVPQQDYRLLFGVPAGRFLSSGAGRNETRIEISLGEMLARPALKAALWPQLRDFRGWALQRRRNVREARP